MPITDAKNVQKELTAKKLRPVYWLYGQELMKTRELTKRILSIAGIDEGLTSNSFQLEKIDGTESTSETILDSAHALSFGGGRRVLIVRDAHSIKAPEKLEPLFEMDPEQAVCIFWSKDLDKRKKFTKKLIEKAVVVPCEDVPENDREAWIGYLAKRRKSELGESDRLHLRMLDPWSLSVVDQELDRIETERQGPFTLPVEEVSEIHSSETGRPAENFIRHFLARKRTKALKSGSVIFSRTEDSIATVGLLNWNIKQLAQVSLNQATRTPNHSLSPFLARRLQEWKPNWDWSELQELQSELASLDRIMKQTPRTYEGNWLELINRFCH